MWTWRKEYIHDNRYYIKGAEVTYDYIVPYKEYKGSKEYKGVSYVVATVCVALFIWGKIQ